ncbi:hypothetical protein GCM10009677_24100 [Sphaerisporangium rubeum]|uniref:Uncharacterized protein n=1 Tax=Sphaerisporangium rubeum TaxID=321317 RepID=A0A7X0M4G7_9ACTN|nr:hypothetical protein [Sphaerisporangium rubeum]MBB6471122.1 hypothetical protein [Sphaerisporangium rubeum]
MTAEPTTDAGDKDASTGDASTGKGATAGAVPAAHTVRDVAPPAHTAAEAMRAERSAPGNGMFRWSGVWRVYVWARGAEIRAEAGRVAALRPGDAEVPGVLAAVEEHVDVAEAYANERQGTRRWLTGQAVEGAWSNIHGATVLLYGLLPARELEGRAPEVLATGRAYLAADDARVQRLAARVAAGDVGEQDRPLLQSVLRAAYQAAAVESGRVRSFRNMLLGGVLILSLIVCGLVALGAAFPSWIPMCGHGTLLSMLGPNATLPQVCPTGGPGPSHGDVPLVALLGVLGAALATAASLSTRSELSTRYSLAVAQNLLKAPAGVATAILGLLILNSGFVPGFTGLSSQTAILVWAMVFGYAQQIVTRFVDQRANSLLHAASPDAPAGQSTR